MLWALFTSMLYLQIAGSILYIEIRLQTIVWWDFSFLPGLLSAFLVVCPAACAREAHSDGAQSVCSPVASSTEAFQLLQGDLTKISCPLLNYNLLLLPLLLSPLLSISDRKIGLPLCFAANWCVCLCVRGACMYVWSCFGCQRKECVRWLAGHASEVGQQGDQELKLLLSAPFHFSPPSPCFSFCLS